MESIQVKSRKEATAKYNILYVDDEEANLRVFKYAFKRDYNILTALNGDLALDVIRENDIHLIITDQRMPRMTGVDLLKRVVPKHPKIIRMIMSGFSDVGVLIDAVNEIGINKYLKKPWNIEDLKSTIDKELEISYGLSNVEVSSEGLIEKTDEMDQNILFTQSKFLKEAEQVEEILGNSFLIKNNENVITSDLHWVGRDKAGQKLVVLIDSHLDGNVGGVLAPAIHHLVDGLINQEDKVIPARLLMEIQNEMLNQHFNDQIKSLTSESVNVCVFAIDENTSVSTYAANYNAVRAFDQLNALIPGDATFGSFSLNAVDRVFISSNNMGVCLNGKLVEELLESSLHMNMAEQHKYLRQHFNGLTDLKALDDMTLIGIDFINN